MEKHSLRPAFAIWVKVAGTNVLVIYVFCRDSRHRCHPPITCFIFKPLPLRGEKPTVPNKKMDNLGTVLKLQTSQTFYTYTINVSQNFIYG